MAVYEDGVLIPGASFPYIVAGAGREAFGTYSFVPSPGKCGSDVAVTRVLHQGKFLGLILTESKWYIASRCSYISDSHLQLRISVASYLTSYL